MKKNPSITELTESGQYELIAEISHQTIKEFVLKQIHEEKKLIRLYTIYQFVMLSIGLFFITLSVIQAFKDNFEPLKYTGGALVFSFSLLIIIHELLHGISLKLTGASRVSYGGNIKKFIFFAEADKHVINRKQFFFIALTPLVVIKAVSIIGIIAFLNQPIAYSFIILMSLHSLFCAGDIGLIAFFNIHKSYDVFTFDMRKEKKSYFFKQI